CRPRGWWWRCRPASAGIPATPGRGGSAAASARAPRFAGRHYQTTSQGYWERTSETSWLRKGPAEPETQGPGKPRLRRPPRGENETESPPVRLRAAYDCSGPSRTVGWLGLGMGGSRRPAVTAPSRRELERAAISQTARPSERAATAGSQRGP